MAEEPSGIFGALLSALRDVLAGGALFQAWVGAEDAAEAAGKIAYCLTEDDLAESTSNPRVVIDYGREFEAEALGFGAVAAGYRVRNSVFLYMEETFTESAERDAMVAFSNTVGGVVAELLASCGGAGIDVLHWEVVSGPSVTFGARKAGDGVAVGMALFFVCGQN